MDCLKPRGTLVSFGTISGPVPPFDTGMLTAKGSLYLTRPSVAHYTADRGELEAVAAAVFEMVENGVLHELEPTLYPLRQAPQAQRDLEAGKTSGSIVLVP
jgi:NADPH:quinone reductase